MSQSKIQQRVPQSFQDFAYRFQLAESLPRDEKGVIIIGNTRAGKSTLALSMAGVPMKLVYASGNYTYINPADQQYKDVVKNTHQSVTQKPNFYKGNPRHNKWAIIDMPGHADSSRFRELINFHYIRTMASNLKYVRFLLVVTLTMKEDKFVLADCEVQMLDSFRIMFPNCGKYVTIIINRLEDFHQFERQARVGFRTSISQCPNSDVRRYYMSLTDKDIYVIERPPYRLGTNNEKQYETSYTSMNLRTKEICNNPQALFIELHEHDYYKLNIFKEGDNINNRKFYDKLCHFVNQSGEGVGAGAKLFKQIIYVLLKSVVENERYEEDLLNMTDTFLKKHDIETLKSKDIKPIVFQHEPLLEKSKVLELLSLVSQEDFELFRLNLSKFNTPQSLKTKEQFCKKVVDSYMSKLLQIIRCIYHQGDLYNKVKAVYLYFLRRITEIYFISNVVIQQNNVLSDEKDLSSQINALINELKHLADENFISYFIKLAEYFENLDVPKLFADHKNHYEKLQEELERNFAIIEHSLSLINLIELETIRPQFQKKKEEITIFVLINNDPTSPAEIKSQIEKLLRFYDNYNIDVKLRIVYKLAKLLEKQKEFKTAVVLCLYLHLNEEVMRLLTLLEPSLKRQELIEWYTEIANIFEQHALFSYAQRCLQKTKTLLLDEIQKFIDYQIKILNLNDISYTSEKLKNRLRVSDKESLWNWAKINEEISNLKQKLKMKDQSSPAKSSLLLKGFRGA